MQKLQDSVFSIVRTTNLSPAVFSFLQPTEDFTDKTPLGGILKDTKHGWLALGPKFCVVDLRTGLKVAARNFSTPQSNINTLVTSVVELPRPLSANSIQLIISLQSDEAGMICVLHVNGSQLLRCIQTEVVVTELAVWDRVPDGPLSCFDGVVMAGTKSGEIFAFDLNRVSLMQALKDISQGNEHLVQNEANPANLSFLQFSAIHRILEQRELALENDDHLAILLNENSLVDGQYIFRNPDGTVRMKAKRDHIRVTVLQYIPQLGSLAVGYNFGAFQIWNIMTLELEFTSQVNVECLPVTHFGFQEPCDDPRAFCYLWVVFSVTDRFEEEEFPLAVMYSLTYQGKRMLSDTKCLYQEFSTATVRFQLELSTVDEASLLGGKCVSCHAYSVNSTLAAEGEESMLNICQIVWECWGENASSSTQYGMLLFDLDQWYKDQMPATWPLQSNAFMSVTWCCELSAGDCVTLDVRLDPASVAVYSHATRLEEHFYPNSLQYNCICLNTSEACVLSTIGIQRQIIGSIDEVGPTALLNPPRLYNACMSAGLTPLYVHTYGSNISAEDQRRYLLSVALEARLSRFLKRCAHDWATGSHSGAGCTLTFMVDWCWKRAIELKENAKELTAPLFTSSALPDRNVVRCLEHCVQQLTQLTGLLDAVLTKCCNLIIPDALSEIEEKYKGIGTVSLYFQVVQWFLRVGLLPERHDGYNALPYPAQQLYSTYNKRRLKLNRLQDNVPADETAANKPCSLLYIDQLIEQEFGGERTHQMWIKGGSECSGLYPPPSLYSLLRLYLLPDIAEEHKHSLVLYLLVDYSMVYDEVRYEAVIRRLMQFPTMFGLSNTAIKATQAFWHLDHRDFDFALDQLQCLTGNTLSDWQHNVVLSTLLAQKKTQAALQYLHVRKPAPIQNIRDRDGDMTSCSIRVNDHDKLEDWQSCCNLYLARGLVFEALDVIRMCVINAGCVDDKVTVLQFFFKGCRNTGNLAKILQVSMTQLEEEIFVKYLKDCNEPQTSDILVMYYLQQSRYLEAERYNNKLKLQKPRAKDVSTSVESLFDMMDRDSARDAIVEVVCSSLPAITNTVAHYALDSRDVEPHVFAAKPMSVYVKAKSPKNTFTYKSSFIQDTIENASETWINKPKMRRGIKRALNVEDTPFICTPKLTRTRSILSSEQKPSESTPPKRARLDLTGTPKTPKMGNSFHVSEKLSSQMSLLLDMPDVQSPDCKLYTERPGTPHSILKTRRNSDVEREAPSPVDSRYLGDSDDELMDTASNHTHYSDANKHLRFTIPTASESGSTPSPQTVDPSQAMRAKEMERRASAVQEKEMDVSVDSFVTTTSHAMTETNPMESPSKKLATEESIKSRKSFKDTVRARRSFSISINSSLSDDPNSSIESIADIPVTLINPRYSGEKRHKSPSETIEHQLVTEQRDLEHSVRETEIAEERRELPKTPKGRRGIRAATESTPLFNRSRNTTPERIDSPITTPLPSSRITRSRSRSRTPELSPRASPLAPIPEQPKQETDSEPHPQRTTLSVPRQLRSRSRTPERKDKGVAESPKLEAISESPTKSYREAESSSSSSTSSGPSLRSRSRTPIVKDIHVAESSKLEAISKSPTKSYRDAESSSSSSTSSGPSTRSRSRTPDIEVVQELIVKQTPRSLRSRSKTPEQLMSPRVESPARAKKSLSRKAFENILMAKARQADQMEAESEEKPETAIACTPMKAFKQVPSLMDVTFSPIVNKSVLQSSTDTTISSAEKVPKSDKSTLELDLNRLPAFTTLQETCIEKSVLHSYESSVGDTSVSIREEKVVFIEKSESNVLKPLPAFTLNESEFDKSVLHSYESSVAEESSIQEDKDTTQTDEIVSKPFAAYVQMMQSDYDKSVLHSAQSSITEASQLKDDSRIPEEPSSLMTNDSSDEENEDEDNEEEVDEDSEEEEVYGDTEEEVDEENEEEEDEDIEDIEKNVDKDIKEVKENVDKDNKKSVAERKEKEKIGEIEREIDAIKDMSEEEQDNSEESESVSSLFESSASEEEDNDQVISVEDSDSSRDKLQIDEKFKVSEQSEEEYIDVVEIEEEEEEPTETKDNIDSLNVNNVASSSDPLNQANFSLMTDDNSAEESDKSDLNLNYSGDSDKVNVRSGTPLEQMEPDSTVPEPAVRFEIPAPVDSQTKEQSPSTSDVDGPKQIDIIPTQIFTRRTATEYKTTSYEDKDIEVIESDKEDEEVPFSKIVPEVTVEVIKVSEEEAMAFEEAPTVIEKEVTEIIPVVTEKVPEVTEDVPKVTEKVLKVKETVTEVSQEASEVTKEVTVAIEKIEEITETEAEKPTRTAVTESVTVVVEKVPVVAEKVSEVTEDVPMATESIPVAAEKLPVVAEKVPEITEDVPMVTESIPVTTEKVPVVAEKVPEVTEDVPMVTESILVVAEKVSDVTENVLTVTESIPIVTEEVLKVKETVTEFSQEASEVTKVVTVATENIQETTQQEAEKLTRSTKRGKSETVTEVSQEAPVVTKEITAAIEKMEKTTEQEVEIPTRSRKRGKSETVTEVSQEAPVDTKGVTVAIQKMEVITEQEIEKPTRSTKRGKSETVTEVSQEAPVDTKGVTVAIQKMEVITEQEIEKPTRSTKRGKSETVTQVSQEAPVDTKEVTVATEKIQETTQQEAEKPTRSTKRGKLETVTKVSQETPIDTKEVTAAIEKMEETTETEAEKPTRSRKRVKSTSSNKSTTEPEIETEIKKPATRKRTQSTASNISMDIELKTPERTEATTPSKRRAKTPTSAEVRKIITRRISRELSGKLDQSNVLDETTTTPKRRSTRTRSKNVDDNESVASESSFVSGRSKASEDAGDRTVKKGRKSVLVSKPELSVIPEVTAEEGSKLNAEKVINEYSSARRLTRHQKAVLESWLEPEPSPRRRTSTASRTSLTSYSVASEPEDDDASSTHSAAFDVQPIDRMSLLNKPDFDGIPDIDELQMNLSPESLASDASKQRRLRLGRAASETKTIPRAAKISRRVSVDVVNSPDFGSPILVGADSPARGRRKSFNRACEALHTPKGRRTSTEVRKGEGESPMVSPGPSEGEAPGPSTPARRTRRVTSNMSNTSQATSETGKRTRKTVVEEAKETKRK